MIIWLKIVNEKYTLSTVKRSVLRFIVLSLLTSCRNYFLAIVSCIEKSLLAYLLAWEQHIATNKN